MGWRFRKQPPSGGGGLGEMLAHPRAVVHCAVTCQQLLGIACKLHHQLALVECGVNLVLGPQKTFGSLDILRAF